MRYFFSGALCLLGSLASSSAFAWGFDGHRRLASHLHDALPADHCVRQWLFSVDQAPAFQAAATDPDKWRLQTVGGQPNPQYDAAEWPRHYLEVDWYNPPANYPRDWAGVQAQFGTYAERNGRVPWRVEEYYAKLVESFRTGDSAATATIAAHFSHYVTDAASVLHDTKNFDPKLSPSDTVGLHARWESDMLQSATQLNGVTAESAKYLGTWGTVRPRDDTFTIVLAGNALVEALVGADVRSNGDLAKLYAETKELTGRRWADALTLYGSLAVAAWVEAGRPQLAGMSAGCNGAAATAPLVLKGYPLAPTPDAGTPSVDAGVADAGSGEDAGSDAPDASIPVVPVKPQLTSTGWCGGTTGVAFVPFAVFGLVFAARRRRPRR